MHLLQVGVGSGGMVVLDLLSRNPAVSCVTIIDPDTYAAHNVYRHTFPHSSVGQLKVELARGWVREIRPELTINPIAASILDPIHQNDWIQLAERCDVGVCAVDNEPSKFAFDALMRRARKPWTLGEVLSGGIGGWVHRFTPEGACYGCVSSHLQRTVAEEPPAPLPNYSDTSSLIPETRVPASKSSIAAIASLHALVTEDILTEAVQPGGRPETAEGVSNPQAAFTSLLLTLQVVPGVFEEAYRTYRFRIPRSPGCLICGVGAPPHRSESGDILDAALDQALDRLAP